MTKARNMNCTNREQRCLSADDILFRIMYAINARFVRGRGTKWDERLHSIRIPLKQTLLNDNVQ